LLFSDSEKERLIRRESVRIGWSVTAIARGLNRDVRPYRVSHRCIVGILFDEGA